MFRQDRWDLVEQVSCLPVPDAIERGGRYEQ